jgi:hypothetical protein
MIRLASDDRTGSPGRPVIANWLGRGIWFYGHAVNVSGPNICVRYIDGDEEWVPWDRVSEPRIVVGLRVLARWKNLEWWFPGVVTEVGEGRVAIQYLDGDREWADPDQVRMDDLGAGDRVMADLQGVRQYYLGRVVERTQDLALVELADGSHVHVPVANLAVDLDARDAGRPQSLADPGPKPRGCLGIFVLGLSLAAALGYLLA